MWNCQTVAMKSHQAQDGEVMEARRLHTGGAALFGDKGEIACVDHRGARLMITSIPANASHPAMRALLPGVVLEYRPRDRYDFLIVDGKEVEFFRFIGCKMQLAPVGVEAPPDERALVTAADRRETALVG